MEKKRLAQGIGNYIQRLKRVIKKTEKTQEERRLLRGILDSVYGLKKKR